jgi:hypothetical protein
MRRKFNLNVKKTLKKENNCKNVYKTIGYSLEGQYQGLRTLDL